MVLGDLSGHLEHPEGSEIALGPRSKNTFCRPTIGIADVFIVEVRCLNVYLRLSTA